MSAVYVSLGPDVYYPPSSYSGYTSNAQTDVRNGVVTPGYPASPTDYHSVTTITNADMSVDGDPNAIPNWRGVYNPGPPFNNESGTMVYFSVDIKGTPGLNNISLAAISTTTTDTDPYTNPPCGYWCDSYSYSGSTYDVDKVGYFVNGTQTSSGDSPSTMVNEIVITSYGLAYDASGYSGTGQDQLNNEINNANQNPGPMVLTVCYSDSADHLSNCGSVNVNSTIPEPSTFGLFGVALAGFLIIARGIRTAQA